MVIYVLILSQHETVEAVDGQDAVEDDSVDHRGRRRKSCRRLQLH